MMTDPISDMLTRLRNAAAVRKAEVAMPYSKVKFAIAKILEKEGYIEAVQVGEQGFKKTMTITLKYRGNRSAFELLKRVSTPGRRVYKKTHELPVILSGFGISIVSTPNGLMTNKEAHSRRLGGEVICEIH